MKKIIIMLILLLVCFVPALAENTPEVIVDPSVKMFLIISSTTLLPSIQTRALFTSIKSKRPRHLMRFQPVQVFLFIDIVI